MLYKSLICLNRQMYISNKMECFIYKGVCGVCGHIRIEEFKEELACSYIRNKLFEV